MECHPLMKEPPNLSFHLIRSHKSATDRQTFEALAIDAEVSHISFKNKTEFGKNFIPRMINNPDTPACEEGPKASQRPSQKTKKGSSGYMIPSDSTQRELFSQQYRQRKMHRVEIEKASSNTLSIFHSCKNIPIIFKMLFLIFLKF